MKKRKNISASLRWQVFARDGFRCRYCGLQVGEPGVILHADHVVSVADGGTNAIDNLVAACQRCNGGKAARSLADIPGSLEAIAFAEGRAASLKEQAESLARAREAYEEACQEIVNLLCDVYNEDSIALRQSDLDRLVHLSQAHGGETLADWLTQAASRNVDLDRCVRYVHGIIRNIRERNAGIQ